MYISSCSLSDLFELEPVGYGANVRVEEVGAVHVEQPLEVVHPDLHSAFDETGVFPSFDTSTVRAVLIPWVSLLPGNV